MIEITLSFCCTEPHLPGALTDIPIASAALFLARFGHGMTHCLHPDFTWSRQRITARRQLLQRGSEHSGHKVDSA
jgi:hypothetical protein